VNLLMSPPLVPFKQADPETQQAFVTGLRARGIEGNLDAWLCTICGATISGDDVLISYGVPTPYPYCTTMTGPHESCTGQHMALVPAPVE
jgi:hypothetical protein